MTLATRAAILGVAAVTILAPAACGSSSTGSGEAFGDGSETTLREPDAQNGDVSDDQLTALDEAEQLFDATVGSTYTVTFDFVGQVSAEAGSVVVEVANDQAVDVAYPEQTLATVLPSIPLLTVDDMFERARSTIANGGTIEVTFDESYGYPSVLSFDPIPEAIDDEFSVLVSSVEPGDGTIDDGDGY